MTLRSARIAGWLAAQERFEAIRIEALGRAGHRLADLAYANAHDGPSAAVSAAMRRALEGARALDLQYTPYGGATLTRREVARVLSESHSEDFHYRDVVLTPGAMAALNIALRTAQGDTADAEAVVITPCWLDYPLYLENLGIEARMVPLRPDLGLDVDAVRAALGPNTRAVLLSQPANPTGRMYSEAELSALADALRSAPFPPLLISDECHRDVRFDGAAFHSPLAFYDRTVVVYSFGKAWQMQGQRIGYAAVSPRMPDREAFARALEQACRYMGFCTPTALMQLVVRRLLAHAPDVTRIAARRARVLDALVSAGYEVAPSQATFFLYPKAPGGDDFAFCASLAREGVLVLPSSVFYHPGHLRISLTASDAMIDRALPALARAAAGQDTTRPGDGP